MTYLLIDIEAIPDPRIPYEFVEGDKLPSAPHWQMVCIGGIWLNDDLTVCKPSAIVDLDEIDALRKIAEVLDVPKAPTLVGFNSRSFDCPIIEARLMRHGIQCARLFSRDVQDRYFSGHIDLCDRIANFGAGRRSGLDACAKLVGFPGKLDVDGGDVARLVAEGHIEIVRSYCMTDVAQMAGVFMRREFVRGALTLEKYQRAAESLIDCINAEPRLAALRGKIDDVTFLCKTH